MTRAEAKAAGRKHYDTCKPCSHGHVPTVRRVLNGRCLACEHVENRISYATKREMHLSASRRWKERNQERMAEYVAATRSRKLAKMAEYRAANHADRVAKKRIWRLENPDKEQAQRRRFHEAHKALLAARFAAWAAAKGPLFFRVKVAKRRFRQEAAGHHTKQDILAILEAQRARCVYCRRNISSCYTVDHIVPLCLGGSNGRANLQLVCKPCNSRKGGKHPVEFAKTLGLLV